MNFKITFASQDESFPLQLGEVTARIVPADPDLQDKTVTPTESTQTVTCDAPHDGLGTVTVNPIPPEYVIPSGAVTIDHNGVSDVAGYASADVHVSPVLQRKSVTPARAAQTVEPDSDKDGLSAVDVGGIPSEYVIPEGTVTLSNNGQHDVSGKASAVVNVQPVLQSKSVTPTRAAQTVTPDSGKDGLSAVEVGGIPSEYIIPEGSKSITENGTHDVTDYASAVVNVPGPSGQIEITENGTVDVAAFASALVNVAGGGGASNVVMGTFTLEDTGATHEVEIEIPYSGTGFPLSVCIVPGMIAGGIYAMVRRYGVYQYVVTKQTNRDAPIYSAGYGDGRNKAWSVVSYKSSTSSSTAVSGSANSGNYVYGTTSFENTSSGILRIRRSNALNLMAASINDTAYGFLPTTYNYFIIYSE